MPDKDDKTKGRTALPGQYAHDKSGDIVERKDEAGPKSTKGANDRRADSTQRDGSDDDHAPGDVPAQHG